MRTVNSREHLLLYCCGNMCFDSSLNMHAAREYLQHIHECGNRIAPDYCHRSLNMCCLQAELMAKQKTMKAMAAELGMCHTQV